MSISRRGAAGSRIGLGTLLVLSAGLVACTATTSGTGVGAPSGASTGTAAASASAAPTGFPSESASSAAVPSATGAPAGTDPSPDGDFAVTLPNGWTDAPEGLGSGIVTAYVGPVNSRFATNINVTREPLAASATLAQYLRTSQAEVRRALSNVTIGASTTTELAGSAAYQYSFSDIQNGRQLRQRQTLTIHDGFGYVVTYTAVPSAFQPSTDGADAIVASWQWL